MSEAGHVYRDARDPIVEALLMGLMTDGAHHKQYYLEQALIGLCTKEWADKAKQKFQWTEGIPS